MKKNWITVAFLAAFIGTTYFIQNTNTSLRNLVVLSDGLQTCTTRVSQSYTARLIGDTTSPYLDRGFQAMTEECFGETLSAAEANFATVSGILEKLNALSKDVHLFHNKISNNGTSSFAGGISPERVMVANLGTKFEKLELKKDAATEAIDESRNSLLNRTDWLKYAFYALAVLFPISLLSQIAAGRNKGLKNNKVETEARVATETETPQESVTEAILENALIQNGLDQCARLFNTYRARKSPATSQFVGAGNSEMITTTDPKALQDQIERVWNSPEDFREKKKEVVQAAEELEIEVEIDHREKVEVEGTITKVIDVLSSKIFTSGVKLEIDLEEGVEVYATQENIEQIFYHVLVNSIDSYDFNDPKKFLSISLRKLGGTVLVDFFDSGLGFSDEFIRSTKGLISDQVDENIELTICQDLAKEFGAKLSFDNVANDDGVIKGSKVQVVLEGVLTEPKKSVVQVKKGKKKDILKDFQAQTQA